MTSTYHLPQKFSAIKRRFPDALCLFLQGDMYRAFQSDARHIHENVGFKTKITFVEHDNLLVLEFPQYELDLWLPRIVNAGYRVAICDSLKIHHNVGPVASNLPYSSRFAQPSAKVQGLHEVQVLTRN